MTKKTVHLINSVLWRVFIVETLTTMSFESTPNADFKIHNHWYRATVFLENDMTTRKPTLEGIFEEK